MTIYGYTRVSTDRQAEGDSLAAQTRQLEGWALMKDVSLGRVFVEEGVSGSIPVRDRPCGREMFSALEAGDTVVSVKLDRMFRSALDALQVVEALGKRKVSLVLLDVGDVTNGLSKLFLTMTAAFAEVERDRIRERVTAMKADQKARGCYLGGKLPYGFEAVEGLLQPVETEQAIIRGMMSLRLSGGTLRACAAYAEREGGRRLALGAVRRLVA